MSMLRLELDREWEPEDFIEVFLGIESLYYKGAIPLSDRFGTPLAWPDPWRSTFETKMEHANTWILSEVRFVTPPQLRLTVARIQYGSPGSIDFFGVARVLEVLVNVIERSILFYSERDIRREKISQARLETRRLELGLEEQNESIRALKLANARELLQLRKDFPQSYSDDLLLLAINDQDKILPRIAEGKLVGGKIVVEADRPPT